MYSNNNMCVFVCCGGMTICMHMHTRGRTLRSASLSMAKLNVPFLQAPLIAHTAAIAPAHQMP